MIDQTEGTFAFLFDALSDGVCVSNGQGDILYMNPAAERLLEVTQTEARSRNFCELLCGRLSTPTAGECMTECPLRKPGSDACSAAYTGRHNVTQAFRWQDERIRRFERWKDLRVRCLKMPGVVRDGGELEKHFTLIEDASAEAELESRKERWRSMAAHDLRSPLTNIIGSLAMLDEIPAGQPLKSEEKKLVAAGLRAGRRMLELLNAYLDVARLDAGKMPLRLEDVRPAKLVKACVEESEAFAREKGVQVVVDIPEDLTLRADPDLLHRVVQNLLSNALKFTPAGGKVTITSRDGSGRGSISFRDTGIGIGEQDLPYVFDRFRQAPGRSARKAQGSGLGLTFCREALKLMGGGIHAESQLGKGSEFTVELPSGVEWRQRP